MAEGSVAGQLLYGLTALSGLPLAYILWQHRDAPGAKPLLGSVVGGFWWSLTLFVGATPWGFERLQTVVPTMYVGVGIVVVSVFVFSLEYTGREHLVTRKLLAALSIEPILVVVIAFLNPGGLFMTVVREPGDVFEVTYEFGALFWVHTAYSYVLVGVAWLFIVGMLYRTRSTYRGHVVALVLAIIVPSVANTLTITRTIEFSTAPIGFAIANALFVLAITRYRLVDLAPIARDRVVDNVAEAVMVLDRKDRLIDVNAAARDLFAPIADGDLIGTTAQDLFAPIPGAVEGYEDIVASGTDQEYEYEVGDRFYEGYATPIEDGRDRIVGWLFLVRDVTDQRRREAELERRNEQLDRFAGVVSHDLRNPLNVATGRAELALETGDLEHVEHVVQAHERIETIVDDVLAVAREGELVSNPEPVALASVADDAWHSVETDGATLVTPTNGTLRADRNRFARLLENLFRNAVDHGRPDDASASDGDADLTVEVGTLGPDGDGATGFYVADDGVGIPADERDAVFESGFSSNADRTGFGLSIVSEIAAAHDWSIDVTESEHGGARFEFRQTTGDEE